METLCRGEIIFESHSWGKNCWRPFCSYYYNTFSFNVYCSHTGIRQHECDKCFKTFMYAEGLYKHKQLHEEERECSTCKKKFPTPKELREHCLVCIFIFIFGHSSVLTLLFEPTCAYAQWPLMHRVLTVT